MFCHNESAILSYRLEVFMVRSLAICQPTPQHWSLSREVSSVLHLTRMSMQTKQRGNMKLDRWVCANLSDSTVHMESVQLILWSSGKTRDKWFKCIERLLSEAYMKDLAWALVKMTQLKLFEVDHFPSESVQKNIGYCPMVDGSPTEFSPE